MIKATNRPETLAALFQEREKRKDLASRVFKAIRSAMQRVDLADFPDAVCPCCASKLVRYRHSLNVALLTGLRALADAGGEQNLKELGLTRNQWDNFQKLRYWGLVEQVEVDGIHKRGVWRMTRRGYDWLAGDLKLPKTAITFRGKTVAMDGDRVSPDDICELYDKREDYARDAEPLRRPLAGVIE